MFDWEPTVNRLKWNRQKRIHTSYFIWRDVN